MKDTEKVSLITTSEFRVSSADTDMHGRLRPGALMNYLIQSAIDSADFLGFGFSNIRTQKLFWVLSRLKIDIYAPLKWYDEVIVETWPKDVERIIYLRDFVVRNGKGEIVAKANSGWLAIDLESKRPKKIDGVNAEFFNQLRERHAIHELPERLTTLVDGELIMEIPTSYYDLDLNKHVTSTRYIDWMMDSFSFSFHEKNYPRSMEVNYIRETLPGEKIGLRRKESDSGEYIFEGQNLTSDTVAFRGRLGY